MGRVWLRAFRVSRVSSQSVRDLTTPPHPNFERSPPHLTAPRGLVKSQESCQISGMLFAKCKNCATRTELRQLRDELETQLRNLKSEWLQHLTSMEDVYDKIDHVVKRHEKRRQRAQPAPEPEPQPEVQLDPVSQRVLERRNGVIRRVS